MSAANILNNTVLVPYHDSLTSGKSHDLEEPKIAGALEKYNTTFNKLTEEEKAAKTLLENQFAIRITSYASESGGSSGSKKKVTSDVGFCQGIKNLSVSRGVKKSRSGGESLYEIKVPEMIDYGEVTLNHLYTNSAAFLDWLVNGAEQGGALMADIEIRVGDETNGWVVYTLRDAFPIQWRLGNLSAVSKDLVEKVKSMQVKDGEIPMEEVTLVYGRLDYSLEPGKSGS